MSPPCACSQYHEERDRHLVPSSPCVKARGTEGTQGRRKKREVWGSSLGEGTEALSLLSGPGKEREEGVETERRNEKSRFSFSFLSKQEHRHNHRL